MNCQEFKRWINNQELADEKAFRQAGDHAKTCRSCEALSQTDLALDAKLKNALQAVEPPPGLILRARDKIESGHQPGGFFKISWKTAVPALSMAALMLVILLNPFSGSLQTLDEVVAQSIENHLDANMEMAIQTTVVSEMDQWLSRRLDFEARLPDLRKLGLSLLGGLKCAFGKTDVALLFCKSKGKRASLFVINPDDVDFRLGENQKYAAEQGNLKVKIWQEAGLVYAMVI